MWQPPNGLGFSGGASIDRERGRAVSGCQNGRDLVGASAVRCKPRLGRTRSYEAAAFLVLLPQRSPIPSRREIQLIRSSRPDLRVSGASECLGHRQIANIRIRTNHGNPCGV